MLGLRCSAQASLVVVGRLNCPTASGIFSFLISDETPSLNWKADS